MNLLRCSILIALFFYSPKATAERCFKNFISPKLHIYYDSIMLDFNLQISHRISHRFSTHVLKILLEEKLGYEKVKLLLDYSEKEDASSIPNVMINLEHQIDPDINTNKHRDTHFIECGDSYSGRYGWFIPMQLFKKNPKINNWQHFNSTENIKYFSIDDSDLKFIKNNAYDSVNKRYFCDKSYCEEGFFVPEQCKNQSCVTLFTSHPENTEFLVNNTVELGVYVKVVWLGDNLKKVINMLSKKLLNENKNKLLVFCEWTPGYYTLEGKANWASVSMPHCEDYRSACKYDLTHNVKRVWNELDYYAKSAYEMVHKMNLNRTTIESMLGAFNGSYFECACQWLQDNKATWSSWMPNIDEKSNLYVGGIFPMSGKMYNGAGIARAARMAEVAINNNHTLLNDYNLVLEVKDGRCQQDIVLKNFMSYVFHRNFRGTIGILGPACSETVEPIIGIAKHIPTMVISYSAEASSFSDQNSYPYFFRTIGENGQLGHVYSKILTRFGWKRVAALAENGQKNTEYLSVMNDLFRADGIKLVANVKFVKTNQQDAFTKHLEDLKNRRAKIIISDVADDVARIFMCEAHKLEMTSKQGYVWFLPSWLPKNWYNTTYYNLNFNENVSCNVSTLLESIQGHFSLKQAAFASDDSIMQENISVREWRSKYKKSLPYRNLESDFAGYAYDAMWIFAYAVDELFKLHPSAMANLHSKETTANLTNIIKKLDFNGVSGRINFHGGRSRFSTIDIRQWINATYETVGHFTPNISNVNDTFAEGVFTLNDSDIVWFTNDGLVPEDGYISPNVCWLDPLAKLLNLECYKAMVLVNVLCFGTFGIILMVIVIVIKRRYDKKVQFNEEIMRTIAMNANGCINMTNLDKWETNRECVVLNRKLGEGAFGNVYGGEAILNEGVGWTAVAVKTLKMGSNRDEKVDFLSEAETMKRFDNSNIVKLLGVCTKTEPFYAIMEFMLYGDLKTYLLARRHLVNDIRSEERGEVSAKKLTTMALDVARALVYLSEMKYVHRDVACRNCLVSAQRVVKLGDFGMTRPLYDNDYYRFNRKGMLPVRWMAPESLGLGIFTPASDVWSFAVLLYEIITFGGFPFQGMNNNEALEHIKKGNTLKIPFGVKPQLENLMKSCWSIDYKKRPRATEIAEFLTNTPRVLSPCLDVPIASIDMNFDDDIDLLPEILARPNAFDENEQENDVTVTLLNSMRCDNPSYINPNQKYHKKKSNGNIPSLS